MEKNSNNPILLNICGRRYFFRKLSNLFRAWVRIPLQSAQIKSTQHIQDSWTKRIMKLFIIFYQKHVCTKSKNKNICWYNRASKRGSNGIVFLPVGRVATCSTIRLHVARISTRCMIAAATLLCPSIFSLFKISNVDGPRCVNRCCKVYSVAIL